MHEDLKSWGHPGGARNAIIMKNDGEPAIAAVREAPARFNGAPSTLMKSVRAGNRSIDVAGPAV